MYIHTPMQFMTEHFFYMMQAWLPSETPVKLHWYRKNELLNLRGNGIGKLEEWDRVLTMLITMTLENLKRIQLMSGQS